MYKQPNTYGHALDQLDSTEIFKTISQGEYANTLVFAPPIDRQASTILAIKALRLNPNDTTSLQLSLNPNLFKHG